MGKYNDVVNLENNLTVPEKLNIELSYEPTLSFSGISSRELKTYAKNISTQQILHRYLYQHYL